MQSVLAASTVTGTGAAKDAAVVRYTTGRQPDLTFGASGVGRTALSDEDYGRKVSVDAFDRLVVGVQLLGGSQSSVTAARFLPNGALDLTYGAGGFANFVTQQVTRPTGLVAAPDGGATLSTNRTLIRYAGG